MKIVFMTMAAASALAVAAPASSQPASWTGPRLNAVQLQTQFDAGVHSGAISRREAPALQVKLRQLTRLEQQYGRNGLNGWERTDLRQRTTALRNEIHAAERNAPGRFDRDRRSDRDDTYDRDDRYGRGDGADRDHRGDRFEGDLRVGQHFTSRQVALPAEFRSRYPDDRSSYHRFDSGRVYQIDRSSGLILRMFDIQG